MSTHKPMLHWLIIILLLCAVLYAAVCALMYFQQRKLMYLPQYTRVAAAQTNFQMLQGGVVLRGWQDHPQGHTSAKPARDAVVYLGGNAERVELALPMLRQWLPESSIYTLAYRGFGASDGTPTEANLVPDATALLAEVQRLHPSGKVVLVGRSLGSGVAAGVAAQRAPSALVLITPFDNMLATVRDHYGWLPVSLLLHDRYPSDERLQHYAGPLLVVRAGLDDLVRPARTAALLQALDTRSEPAADELVFAEADHITILTEPRLGSALRVWLIRWG